MSQSSRGQRANVTLSIFNLILIIALVMGFFWLRARDSQQLAALEDQLAQVETELQAIDSRYLTQLERLLTERLPSQLGSGFDTIGEQVEVYRQFLETELIRLQLETEDLSEEVRANLEQRLQEAEVQLSQLYEQASEDVQANWELLRNQVDTSLQTFDEGARNFFGSLFGSESTGDGQ